MQPTKLMSIAIAALAVIAVVLMPLTGAWAASKERVLYSFNNDGKDGLDPAAGLTFDTAGNLYGTTAGGGSRLGTVFELTRGAQGQWTEKVLYSFTGNPDGEQPFAGLIFDATGNLYGTTAGGGTSGRGTVFELTPGANGQWTETVLHSFQGDDGNEPRAGLIFDTSGNLYGTTVYSGAARGTVFELTPRNGQWTEAVLYNFHGSHHGSPYAGLIFDMAGNLYGTAVNHHGGTVFELIPGSNGWSEKNLHGSRGSHDGVQPFAGLILDAAGNLYGTTLLGGAHHLGTVFELTPGSNGKWTETLLHSFGKGLDGQSPQAGLVLASTGKLYGTTQTGGMLNVGTVFALTPGAHGKWTEKVVHSFGHGKDGARPVAGLIEKGGKLYGTTFVGGANGVGTVFELTP